MLCVKKTGESIPVCGGGVAFQRPCGPVGQVFSPSVSGSNYCHGALYLQVRIDNHEKIFHIFHSDINPLKPELNPICYLLALLGAHHFLHVNRIRVKLLTFRRLMSYIYGAPILDVSRSHTTTQHSR